MTVPPKFPIPPEFPEPRSGTAVSWDQSVGRSDVDIVDAIAQFRVAFRRLDMEPPDVITFESQKDGYRFLHHLTQREVLRFSLRPERAPIKVGDDHWHEAEVVGMRFRWPARPIKLPNGGTGWT